MLGDPPVLMGTFFPFPPASGDEQIFSVFEPFKCVFLFGREFFHCCGWWRVVIAVERIGYGVIGLYTI
jgi:hypothetical protein